MPEIERLTYLADLLDALPKERGFNIHTFGSVPSGEPNCGTTACACGYAALDPHFMKQGFRLRLEGRGGDLSPPIQGIMGFNKLKASEERDILITYKGETGKDAADLFFGLERGQFDELFMVEGYGDGSWNTKVTAKMVAKKIRKTFGIKKIKVATESA